MNDWPHARALVVRVLGGRPYFADGFERLARECRTRGIAFIALPGEQGLDPELTSLCHAPLPVVTQVLEYFTQGGVANLVNLLRCLSDNVLRTGLSVTSPLHPLAPRLASITPTAPEGLEPSEAWLSPGSPTRRPGHDDRHPLLSRPTGWRNNLRAPIDAMIRRVRGARGECTGAHLSATASSSQGRHPTRPRGVPNSPSSTAVLDRRSGQVCRVDVLISTLSFSVANLSDGTHTEATGAVVDLLERLDVPVLQAVLCTSSSQREWEASSPPAWSRAIPP